jgi:hypothetical protein
MRVANLGKAMKINCATVIILIGWYLMLPPLVNRSGVLYMQPNVSAPLTEWRAADLQTGTTLDSAQTCEDIRSKMTSAAKKFALDAPTDIENMPMETSEQAGKWIFALEIAKSRCIASDDPRLKAQ